MTRGYSSSQILRWFDLLPFQTAIVPSLLQLICRRRLGEIGQASWAAPPPSRPSPEDLSEKPFNPFILCLANPPPFPDSQLATLKCCLSFGPDSSSVIVFFSYDVFRWFPQNPRLRLKTGTFSSLLMLDIPFLCRMPLLPLFYASLLYPVRLG